MDRFVGQPKFKDKIYFQYERQDSEQRPTKRAFGRANSGVVFQEAQALDMCSVPMLHLFYSDKSFSGQHGGRYPVYREFSGCHFRVVQWFPNYFFVTAAECPLNLHESERRKPENWTPIAWFPIYDEKRSTRPTQGYDCDAARNMRLFHDCWRNVLGKWPEKTRHARIVVYGDGKARQTRSYAGGLLADQQVSA